MRAEITLLFAGFILGFVGLGIDGPVGLACVAMGLCCVGLCLILQSRRLP